MTDSHDPMCPQHGQTMRSIIAFDTPCRCEFIDRVRADERARAYPGREIRSQLLHAEAQVRWAEAVAARLVEVICEQEAEPRCRTCGIRTLRAQIAADIEAVRQSHQNCPHPECAQAYRDAARIARGDT